MKNELFERELQNTSINDVSLADYVKENYLPISVLDKIRAEIDDLDVYYDNDYFCGNKDAMYKRNEVLQIIDKYRGEEV